MAGPPRFLRVLLCRRRALRPRRDLRSSHSRSIGAAAAQKTTTALAFSFVSRLYHTARALPVYASQPGSPPDHATLGTDWLLAFAGLGSLRARTLREVSVFDTHPPLPGFAWRTFRGNVPHPRGRTHGAGGELPGGGRTLALGRDAHRGPVARHGGGTPRATNGLTFTPRPSVFGSTRGCRSPQLGVYRRCSCGRRGIELEVPSAR